MSFERGVFLASCAVLGSAVLFLGGYYVGKNRVWPFRQINAAVMGLQELTRDQHALAVDQHLQPARGAASGVTVGADLDDGALILVSSFYDEGNEIRLIRRDGTPVARWPVDYFTLFPDRSYLTLPPQSTLNTDIHGMVIRPNGDLIFNFDYAGMVALSRCGAVLWTLPAMTHHSIEFAEGGGLWSFGRRQYPARSHAFAPFVGPAWEDYILKVSDDGKVLREIDLMAPLLASKDGMAQLTAVGGVPSGDPDGELIHPNKVVVLSPGLAPAFPMFAAGDLLVSERTYNLIAVLDGTTGAVKWRQVGPYIRQHDPEFAPDGTIVLFDNNAFESRGEVLPPAGTAPVSTVMALDPADGSTTVLYGDRPGEEMLSRIRGKIELLPEGHILITEFEGGRVIEIDADRRKVWEYVNRHDDRRVAEVTEARLYPPGAFTVADWSCP